MPIATLSHERAFSLIELSIVLVILGLLVGGILAGKSLIRAAELRSVGADYSRYVAAAHAFRDKYFYLPGDVPNATSFWGALDSGNGIGSDCQGESSGLPTCNGDGNGQLDLHSVSTASTYEQYLFWKHLANAGLIEGTYTGNGANVGANTICNGASFQLAGCNTPLSKAGGGVGWMAAYTGTVTAHSHLFDGSYGNTLYLSTNNSFNTVYSLTSPELWNIDTKLDDGKPATGKLVAARWNVCVSGAADTSDVANATWLLNSTTLRCVPVFRNVF